MIFRLDVTLSDDDYFAFNNFHSFESVQGKKLIKKSRIFFILAMLFLATLFVLMIGFTTFSLIYTLLLFLFTTFYMALFKKILARNIKVQIKRLKKTGKLPFEPVSSLEFYEDKIVEITEAKRTEQAYTVLEKICVAKERYVFLYTSSVGAYILPMAQLDKQLDQEAFLDFLMQKCSVVEEY